MTTRLRLSSFLATLLLAMLNACAAGNPPTSANRDTSPPPAIPMSPRTWVMGFGFAPPRPTAVDVLKGIDMWSQRAEVAVIHEELPWKDLLGGMPAEAILDRDKVELVRYMRTKGLKLLFMADLNDGLSRGDEAPQLRALDRSIAETAVQQAYRRYVLAVDRKLKPDYIGLAPETNLVRQMAPPKLYAATVRAANDAAADLRAAGSKATLMTSIQVDAAWGTLGAQLDHDRAKTAANHADRFVGIEQDFVDFPFTQVLGLSSYPYLSYAKPDEIPNDWLRRPLKGRSMPVMVVEGGWTSASVATVRSSPQMQAAYVARLGELADGVKARGIIQLVFADIDTRHFPKPLPATLPLFTDIGLVDVNFKPKPALAEWDRLHARKLAP